ncbi:ABC-ATPase domain-containing protein, partial [Staphylococcus hominis]|uniref:ABC-ATPase domain-containing protein n=1 Tax=Staphylococcus hominis TaxID=1290 RepID=UPI0028D83708
QPLLKSLHPQKYPPYKPIKPIYQFHQFPLPIHHLQLHPFPPPSKIPLIIPKQHTQIPNQLLDTKHKPIPTSHFLTPTLHTHLKHFNPTLKPSPKNAKIFIHHPRQDILQ